MRAERPTAGPWCLSLMAATKVGPYVMLSIALDARWCINLVACIKLTITAWKKDSGDRVSQSCISLWSRGALNEGSKAQRFSSASRIFPRVAVRALSLLPDTLASAVWLALSARYIV